MLVWSSESPWKLTFSGGYYLRQNCLWVVVQCGWSLLHSRFFQGGQQSIRARFPKINGKDSGRILWERSGSAAFAIAAHFVIAGDFRRHHHGRLKLPHLRQQPNVYPVANATITSEFSHCGRRQYSAATSFTRARPREKAPTIVVNLSPVPWAHVRSKRH